MINPANRVMSTPSFRGSHLAVRVKASLPHNQIPPSGRDDTHSGVFYSDSFSMKEQKEKLNTTFEDWRGEVEQIDNVTVIGIRLS